VDEVAALGEDARSDVSEVSGDLNHPGTVGLVGDATDLHAAALEPDEGVATSTEKKSIAAMAPQCALRNVAQDIRLRRSGAGSTPCCFKIRLIVVRPIPWPRLLRAPRILV
jgi:hypothetical protein